MIAEKCLAPLWWVERNVPGMYPSGRLTSSVERVLQQQWELTSYPEPTAINPMPAPEGVSYEWRDVPIATEALASGIAKVSP